MSLAHIPPATPPEDEKLLQVQVCVKPLIALVTVLAIGISVLCLSFGYSIVFPHLYYIPIIIICTFFPRYGIYFTATIAVVYVSLVMGITRDAQLLFPALVRSAFFMIVGAVLTGAREAYTYLPDSTEGFVTAEQLASRLATAGFREITFRRLMFGTIAIHRAVKQPLVT